MNIGYRIALLHQFQHVLKKEEELQRAALQREEGAFILSCYSSTLIICKQAAIESLWSFYHASHLDDHGYRWYLFFSKILSARSFFELQAFCMLESQNYEEDSSEFKIS